MLTASSAIRTYFAKLGLQHEIADIYLALHEHGPQSIAALSRSAGIERTRIYRLIDTLLESNLIEVEQRGTRAVMKPAPIANLSILIGRREQELRSIHDELGLIEQVLARTSISNAVHRVQLFAGMEGFRQMQQNGKQARGKILRIARDDIPVEQTCTYRVITGPTLKKRYTPELSDMYAHRFIADRVFHIAQSFDVYNDVIAYYTWKDSEVFGLEVHNKEAADTQRQLFELLWDKAMPHS